jgi:RND family efflux transporter MFP subunit
MNARKRLLTAVLLVAAVAVVIIAAVWSIGRGPTEVDLVPAVRGFIKETTMARGRTVPVEQIEIRTDLQAPVANVYVDVGDEVMPGQVLAQIDPDRFTNLLNRAITERDNALRMMEEAEEVVRRREELCRQDMACQEDLDEARRNYSEARGDLEAAEIDVVIRQQELSSTTIVSPIRGVVSARYINPGEMPTGNLFRLDTDQIHFKALIDEERSGNVELDQIAGVTLTAHPGKVFQGTVDKISPAVEVERDQTGVPIWVTMPASPELIPGLNGHVKIESERPALVIPMSALTYFSANRALVFVVEDGVARLRPVVFGASGGGKTEILEGLEAGETVVLDPGDLEDGDSVASVDQEARSTVQ